MPIQCETRPAHRVPVLFLSDCPAMFGVSACYLLRPLQSTCTSRAPRAKVIPALARMGVLMIHVANSFSGAWSTSFARNPAHSF